MSASHGEHAFTLTVTDIATGWTENQAVRNKAQKWVFAALSEIVAGFPFPILGIDSDKRQRAAAASSSTTTCRPADQLTANNSRSPSPAPGRVTRTMVATWSRRVEQKNWAVVRRMVGYHRYTGDLQVDLLNGIYALLRDQINFFTPQQKLIAKTRTGAKVSKRYDTAQTPFQRVLADLRISRHITAPLQAHYHRLNPARIRREILALSDALAAEVTRTYFPIKPYRGLSVAGISGQATTRPTRAS